MTKEQDAREFDTEPSWWESWNDKDGYGVWPTRDEAECHCAHDAEPVPLYKIKEGEKN